MHRLLLPNRGMIRNLYDSCAALLCISIPVVMDFKENDAQSMVCTMEVLLLLVNNDNK